MTRFVLSALVIVLTLGVFAATGTAQAAPPSGVRCTGSNSVWDDTDIVHLTKEGAGTLVLSWTARGHTTLNCGTGSQLTGQVAHIEQRVRARVMSGVILGDAHTRVTVAGKQHIFQGNYRGTTTVNAGTLSVQAEDGDTDGNDFLLLRQHGTINLAAKQWTNIYIDDIIIGLK